MLHLHATPLRMQQNTSRKYNHEQKSETQIHLKSGNKKISLADLIVLGGCAAVEAAAKAAAKATQAAAAEAAVVTLLLLSCDC